ncbi:unnamed protein product [Dibothriocephalus latus]|uniref:Reverse transcriptase domain-containing protein n=1 Tax=Dibothriocephalus latus TaxID=60516 RepID=A0A3P7MU47_DIBLA|nr:unnamed protein product [Dibothriocephalus latus]
MMTLSGLPPKIIAMIKACYRSTTAQVLAHNNFSEIFAIRSGVRKGCALSLILFKYFIDWVLGKALQENDGIELAPGRRLTELDYADDIAFLASSFGDLQSMVKKIAKSVSLSIKAGKTKVFSCCIPAQEKAALEISGCQLEEVDSFNYFGARLMPNKDDIFTRVDAARRFFSNLPISIKVPVCRASVRSVLLYGCERWAMRVENERKLEVFDHYCLRTILRVK